MKFCMGHTNINVSNLENSIAFYEQALGLSVKRSKESEDGSFKLVYLSDGQSDYELELTWLREHPQAYNLGENEWHVAFYVDEYEKAHELHQQMGCICFENPGMGIYFIQDPDGYWLEVIPKK